MNNRIKWIGSHRWLIPGIALLTVLLAGLTAVILGAGNTQPDTPTTQGIPGSSATGETQNITQAPTEAAQTAAPTVCPTAGTQPTQPTQVTETVQPTQPEATENTAVTQPTQQVEVPPTQPPVPTDAAQQTLPADPKLSDFTIVTNAENRTLADSLSAAISGKYGVTLPVMEEQEFTFGSAIYLGTDAFNSYGGYRYCICVDQEAVAIHVKGSGAALEAAVQELVNQGLSGAEDLFPFALRDSVTGYCWNNSGATSLGIRQESVSADALAAGVTLYTMQYKNAAGLACGFYCVTVKADSDAKMMAVAAPWDETNNAANPVELYTVAQYAKQLTDTGYRVLAISNGGFFDRNTGKTNLPYGAQILDGKIKQTPGTQTPNSNNWVGMTRDGQYVISNAQGYSRYHGRLLYALGGGAILMRDGVPTVPAGELDYRTCVGITKNGDLVILTADNANYAMLVHALMDLDLDVQTVLNMDGGGSTTLYTEDRSGALELKISRTPDDPRRVADALAIVLPL